ncbi:GNAT family N-acetyltransferase [Nakamurella endophytica]|uniref:N-acetyltransferase domain-containing protein n=1 Tax=Nakamurella endophytica TaxID=1748367 RepID=A0A917WCR2_9ACTN|nr:GNAT family N-acetyltransferase [Nakamurella endophytica]GGL92208.1 hypothetical protein GCM10011594_09950 [Nakamurella endophytica]
MTLRAASPDDDDATARLLVQRYEVEVPGMLHGPPASRFELARRLVRATPRTGRTVLELDGDVVGMGALATAARPRPSTPARVLLQAPAVLGPFAGLRTVVGAVRGAVTVAPAPAVDQAMVHSLVVDRSRRGEGLGAVLLDRLEDQARSAGLAFVVLQVVASNRHALSFYRSRGYRHLDAPPPFVSRLLGYRTVQLVKGLARAAPPHPGG